MSGKFNMNNIDPSSVCFVGNANQPNYINQFNQKIKQLPSDFDFDFYVCTDQPSLIKSDYKKLKELAGFNVNVFFDTKGKLKLDKKMLLRIDQWEGEISTLTNLKSFSYDSASNRSETKSSMFIEIPDGPRFILIGGE